MSGFALHNASYVGTFSKQVVMHSAGWGACGIDVKVNLIAMLFMHHIQYVSLLLTHILKPPKLCCTAPQ